MSFISFMRDNDNGTTSVDNSFIKNYMPNMSGDFLKIYLYMLMLSSTKEDVSIDEVASRFGIFSSEIIKALNSMADDGICNFIKNGDNFALSFSVKKSLKSNNASSNANIAMRNNMMHDDSQMINFSGMPNTPLGLTSFDSNSYASANNMAANMQQSIQRNMPNTQMQMQQQMLNQSLAQSQVAQPNNKDMVLNFTNNVNNNGMPIYDYMPDNINTNMSASMNAPETMQMIDTNIIETSIADDEDINIPSNYATASAVKATSVTPKVITKYTPEELSFLLEANSDITELQKFIETTYGTTFNGNAIQTLVNICEQDYVPNKTLKLIVSYLYDNCSKITKLSPLLTALENKAIEINERGLKTEDEINAYLTSTSQSYMEIFKRFGIIGRTVAPAEKTYIDKWLYSYKMPMELILEACDKTIRKTNRASFEYADAIIKGWRENNITTMAALDKASKAPKVYKVPNANYQKQTNKFNNYTENKASSLSDFEMQNMTKLYDKYGINK